MLHDDNCYARLSTPLLLIASIFHLETPLGHHEWRCSKTEIERHLTFFYSRPRFLHLPKEKPRSISPHIISPQNIPKNRSINRNRSTFLVSKSSFTSTNSANPLAPSVHPLPTSQFHNLSRLLYTQFCASTVDLYSQKTPPHRQTIDRETSRGLKSQHRGRKNLINSTLGLLVCHE